MMTGDWIDKLFADDLLSWRTYLTTQMEYLSCDRLAMAMYTYRIKTGDRDELRKITDEFADLIPPLDPKKQFEKHMKQL
jgi:hypothetical protein